MIPMFHQGKFNAFDRYVSLLDTLAELQQLPKDCKDHRTTRQINRIVAELKAIEQSLEILDA